MGRPPPEGARVAYAPPASGLLRGQYLEERESWDSVRHRVIEIERGGIPRLFRAGVDQVVDHRRLKIRGLQAGPATGGRQVARSPAAGRRLRPSCALEAAHARWAMTATGPPPLGPWCSAPPET